MYKKSHFLFSFIGISLSLLFITCLYLYKTKTLLVKSIETKKQFVKITSLPDLAISTESTSIRHRSLSDLFSIYKDDGNLREYFPSTFVYNHSTLFNNTPSKITNAK